MKISIDKQKCGNCNYCFQYSNVFEKLVSEKNTLSITVEDNNNLNYKEAVDVCPNNAIILE